MRGDESYGRNWGYFCILDAFRDVFERGSDQKRLFHAVTMGTVDASFYRKEVLKHYEGGFVNGGVHQLERPNFFIVPQGRCAETLLFSCLADSITRKGGNPTESTIISNGFFDTTAANASTAGFKLQPFTQPGLSDPFPAELIGKENPFKGNLDIVATKDFLDKNDHVTMILITITNNWAAGQPVSMANIRDAAALAKSKDIPLFFDACRFAENAFFIHKYEKGFSEKTIPEIVQEMFSYVDGFTISLKKDALANIGGVLCFKDKSLFASRYEEIGLSIKQRQLISYGNDAYGGSKLLSSINPQYLIVLQNTDSYLVSGRDLMAATAGLYENTKLSFLQHRIGQVQSFATKLNENGIDVLSPPGGHAVYLDMDKFFHGCDRKPEDFASVGFTLELIKEFGIRSAESGPFAWEADKKTPEEQSKIPNLVRFAVPRNVFSDEHIDYSVASIKELHKRRHTIPNVIITRGKDMRLRHFGAGMQPVPPKHVRRSYLDESRRQLELLSQVTRQDEKLKKQLLDALTVGMGKWGHGLIPEKLDRSGWLSNLSNDHSPIEFSMALDQKTGESELRFMLEAQSTENDIGKLQESALQLNQDITAKYGDMVSFDRFDVIRDLFMPPGADKRLAAWHSFAISKGLEKWKLYLNPFASGEDKASAVTQETLSRLGYDGAWDILKSIMSTHDYIVYIGLGCFPNSGDSEMKVYIAHPNATSSQIARKHVEICPEASTYEIEQFLITLSGQSTGPYIRKPVLTTLAFKQKDIKNPIRTVHFPIDSYVTNDAEAQDRIEHYMDLISAPVTYREKYRRAVATVQRRPLASGRGIHSWVSLKRKLGPKGRVTNTFYLSPEFYGPLEAPKTNGIK